MRPMIKYFIVDCVLAVANVIFMCINLALGRSLWWISLIAACVATFAAIDALVSDRKLKRLEQLFRREQQFYNEYIAKRTAEAGKEAFCRLHSPGLPREPKRRESGEKRTKRLINLALHHPKARVRKKNANRIIKMQGKEKKCK